jgi:hypothetical protein
MLADNSSTPVRLSTRRLLATPSSAISMAGRGIVVGMAAKKSVATPKRVMSKQHKAALAVGRAEALAVRRYLDALEAHKPKRGRKRTPASIERRLAAIDASLPEVDRLTGLKLAQERMDLQAVLESMSAGDDLHELAGEFIAVAAHYSTRQGISYAAWREAGVPAAVLSDAGIGRGGSDRSPGSIGVR